MNTARTLLLIGVAIGGCPTVCTAGIIYSQTTPEEPGSSFASSNIVDQQKIADNFLVSGTGQYTVRSLRVIGGYDATGTVPNPLPIDDFRITFLDDTAEAPGAPVAGADFANLTAVRRTPTGGQLLGGLGAPIEFAFDFGDGITLDHGTEYWVSISNNPTPGSGWAWARGVGLLDQSGASTFGDVSEGPWNVFDTSSMWFELSSHNVPEPTTLVLALSATVLTALAR